MNVDDQIEAPYAVELLMGDLDDASFSQVTKQVSIHQNEHRQTRKIVTSLIVFGKNEVGLPQFM